MFAERRTLLTILLAIALSKITAQLLQAEKDVLVLFYQQTQGPDYWTTKWNLSTDPCVGLWFKVTCNTAKTQVTRL